MIQLKPITICVICVTMAMSGCLESDHEVEEDYDLPLYIPIPTRSDVCIEPIPLDRVEFDDCPKSLKRYNRDGDSYLNKFELKALETDFFYERLTPLETLEFVTLIGYTPSINWNPPATAFKEYKLGMPVSIGGRDGCGIFDGYYSVGNLLDDWDTPFETFMNSGWNHDNQYELNKFDCSQMAAYMEYVLENSGYTTVVRIGYYEDGTGHAWILTDRGGERLAYECTGCYWVYPDKRTARKYQPYGAMINPTFYTAGIEYDSIHDIYDDYGEEEFLQEFGWWID